MAPSRTKPSTPLLSEVARHLVIPEGIVTTGWPAVEAKGAELGIGYDWWQRSLGRVLLGKRLDGKYAATVGGVTLSIPRQVGKTYFVGSLLVILCILFPGLRVLWTAHHGATTANTFASMQGICRRRKVEPHVSLIRTANGQEAIRFRNGSSILFGAREHGFGRGLDAIDVVVFDEAQILKAKTLEDMVPATNQARHPHGALLFFMGTPPTPDNPGDEFERRRERAINGKTADAVYLELSADEAADPDDVKQWRKANPSYPTRTPHESMLRMRENLGSDDAWLREALGIWPKRISHNAVLPNWSTLARETPPDDAADGIAPDALAVDMSHDRVVAIAGCWAGEATAHVEVLALDVAFDTKGAEDWLVERAARRIPVLVDGMSPAASMVPNLKARGVRVTVTTAADMAKACGGFYDDAAAEPPRLTHDGEPQLADALAGATRRKIGDAGGWGWDRRDPSVNIAPLVAVTLARHGAVSNRKPARRRPGGRRVVSL